jgi:hypothetical protein
MNARGGGYQDVHFRDMPALLAQQPSYLGCIQRTCFIKFQYLDVV